jgi:hypothetical protein
MGFLTPNTLTTNLSANGLFLARLNTAQSIANSTMVTVIFDNEVIDGRNQYNNATGVFTCSLAGYWQFNTYVRISATASITNAILQITHNSQGYRGQQIFDPSATATAYGLSMGIVIPLSVGDTVQVQGFSGTVGTSTYPLLAGVYPTAFSGYLVAV